ncbi:hypothetical protein QEH56_19115 [Pelagicoccus enzymogenes]|uniref:hypothetical protein n=1 Tax=Pelagicoccus enzymogenes TaxID=2773457 RepID=UPI00280DAE35|nr:hypothetical protein [Pelagicoccus enzymogenes]MDQ8200282.1 hypothetical protein [Pelagicoccus enzymogenes]
MTPCRVAGDALAEGQGPPEPFLSDDPEVTPSQAVWSVFQKYVNSREALPRQLLVTSGIAEKTFAPLRRFGVEIVRVERHEALGGLFAAMARFG